MQNKETDPLIPLGIALDSPRASYDLVFLLLLSHYIMSDLRTRVDKHL